MVEAAPARRVAVDERLARVAIFAREDSRSDGVDDAVAAARDVRVRGLLLRDERQRLLAARPVRDVAESLFEAATAVVALRGAVLELGLVGGEGPGRGVRVEDVARCSRDRIGRVVRGQPYDAERREREHGHRGERGDEHDPVHEDDPIISPVEACLRGWPAHAL